MRQKHFLFCAALAATVAQSGLLPVYGNGPAASSKVTYRGQLVRGSTAVNDVCTMHFSLWDAPVGGNHIGTTAIVDGIEVVDGVFSAVLDFGIPDLGQGPRWIQIRPNCTADVTFTDLPSRSAVTPSPNAHIARSATDQIPQGVIAMWSGLLADIPAGWALCDGSNGTPDLQDRFIYGVGDAEEPGAMGGTTSHEHLVDTHSHSATPPTAIPTETGGDHTHVMVPHAHMIDFAGGSSAAAGQHSHAINYASVPTSSVGNHTHTANPVAGSTGGAGNHSHGGASGGATNLTGGKILAGQNDGVVANHTHTIGSGGSHSHSFDLPNTTSSSSGGHSHSLDIPTFNVTTNSAHTHAYDVPGFQLSFASVSATTSGGGHTHTADLPTLNSETTAPKTLIVDHSPKYYKLAFIMRQ